MSLRIAGSALRRVLILSVVALAAPSVARASSSHFPFGEQAKLGGIGDALGDNDAQFGGAVAADGDTLVVGAPYHHGPGRETGAVYVFVRAAGTWTREATLVPSEGASVSGFGSSVAVSGDTVVVGAPRSNRAFVYVRENGDWVEQARLVGSDVDVLGKSAFGASVSLSGDTAIVGAPGGWYSLERGSAYVFVRSGSIWAEQQKILSPDVHAGDAFGRAVAVSGDSLVAGSPGDDASGPDAGSAYVYVRSGATWSQQAKLAGTGSLVRAFGSGVSLDGDGLAISAPNERTHHGHRSGTVYVFNRIGTSWSLQQRLVGNLPPYEYAYFGWGLALDADAGTLLVGSPQEGYLSDVGVVHVFARSGGSWTETQTLAAGLGGGWSPGFGLSVALAGDAAFVGAPWYDVASGFVAAYRNLGSWSEEARLVAPGTAAGEAFGQSTALDGDTLVVGAPEDSTPAGRRSGSAYVFVRGGEVWTLQQKITPRSDYLPYVFGTAVALSGDTLAVSAADVFGAQTIYVFVRVSGVWRQQAILSAGPPHHFPFRIALDGDTLVAGVPDEILFAGAAYVFVRSGTSWSLQQRLSAPAGSLEMGDAVAVQGDTVFLGAPARNRFGEVVVFHRTDGLWTQQARLAPSDPQENDWFGASVAVSAGTLLVGSPLADADGQQYAGTAYVFERVGDTWEERQKIVGSSAETQRELGLHVALSGRLAVLSTGQQAVHLFERVHGTWKERQVVRADDSTSGDYFGYSVSMSGTTVAVGAIDATTPGGFKSGATYVYVPAVADVSLGLSGIPASMAQGDSVTATIAVSNAGPTAAPEVRVTATIDPGLVVESFQPSQGACGMSAAGLDCDLGLIGAGETATVAVVAIAVGTGAQTVQASAAWPGSDPVPGNESASVTTTVTPGGPADVAVTNTSRFTQASTGISLVYDIVVTNHGPGNAAGVVLQDLAPSGLGPYTVSGDCSSLPCAFSRLEPGETRTVSPLFYADPSYSGPDPLVSTATVSAATPDPDPTNDASTSTVPFFEPGPPADFHTVAPCRVLDTRDPARGGPDPFSAGSFHPLSPPSSSCGVPFTARAVAVNVTVIQPTTAGNLRLYPLGLPLPGASTLNYGAGQTRGNNAIVSLSSVLSPASLMINVAQATGTVHVIVDVFGYFE